MDGRRLPQALREGLPARPGQEWAPVVAGAPFLEHLVAV